jgi:hypothetical protein
MEWDTNEGQNMNRNRTSIKTRFGAQIAFSPRLKQGSPYRGSPSGMGARDAKVIKLTAPVRGSAEAELDSLKDRLLRPLLEKSGDQHAETALRRAGTEAAALAWTTPFPLLFLPALLDEKVDKAAEHLARQRTILERGSCKAMAA